MAAILCDVVRRRRRRRRRRRWAHAPVLHAASHFYHEKRVAWVSISMHACDPVPIVMGLRLAALRAARALLLSLRCVSIFVKCYFQAPSIQRLLCRWSK